jgi:uncharacterized RDD family membrane protein YckC
MFCPRCGGQVAEGHKFCQICGQPVGAAVAPAPPPPPVSVDAPPPMATPTPMPAAAYRPSAPTYAPAVAPLPYGGFWERVGAYLIDGMILGIPFGIVMVILVFMFGGFGVMMRRIATQPQQPPDPQAAMALIAPMFMLFFIWMAVFMILQWLYFAGMESSPRQATFGKSIMSLQVTNTDGQRLSFGHATGRFFAKIVSGMVPLAIGFIMAAFTARKQALHDLIAGTLVLRK